MTGRIDIVYRGTDTVFYHGVFDGQNLTMGFTSIGGNFVYDPVTLLWGPDLVYVFGVGFDSIIYYKSLHKVTGQWFNNWTELKAIRAPSNGLLSTASSEPLRWAAKPAVASLYPKSMEVIGLASDNTLYHSSWKAGGGWSAFSPLPDKHFRETPSVVSWGSGRRLGWKSLSSLVGQETWLTAKRPRPSGWGLSVNVNNVGFGCVLGGHASNSRSRAGRASKGCSTARSFQLGNLHGPFVNTPSAVTWAKGKIDLVGLGAKGKVYHLFWDEDSETGNKKWKEIGMTSGPLSKLELVSWAANRLDVFVIGNDRAIHHRWLNKSRGSTWEPAGKDETIMGESAWDQLTAASMSKDNLVVFHIGRNSDIYVKSWTASGGWVPAQDQAYTALGGAVLSRIAACAAQDAMYNP